MRQSFQQLVLCLIKEQGTANPLIHLSVHQLQLLLKDALKSVVLNISDFYDTSFNDLCSALIKNNNMITEVIKLVDTLRSKKSVFTSQDLEKYLMEP